MAKKTIKKPVVEERKIDALDMTSLKKWGDPMAVICSICAEDYANSLEKGGFVFLFHAVCPNCAILTWKHARKHKQTHMIRALCPEDMAFRDFIYNVKNGNHAIAIKELI